MYVCMCVCMNVCVYVCMYVCDLCVGGYEVFIAVSADRPLGLLGLLRRPVHPAALDIEPAYTHIYIHTLKAHTYIHTYISKLPYSTCIHAYILSLS